MITIREFCRDIPVRLSERFIIIYRPEHPEVKEEEEET